MNIEHTLTSEESAALERLEAKLDHIRDAVNGVVKGYHSGLFLYGEGGTSKSYTVINALQELKAKYVLHNTSLTPRGLFDVLERAPAIIHFIEDAEPLLDNKRSYGLLRSASWSQSTKQPMERPITWTTCKRAISFTFTGGIILISNSNLADAIPEVRAIKTRINVLGMDVPPDEIKALMTKICLGGYQFGDWYLDVEECLQVRDFVISRLSQLRRNLDLRLMINGFKDFLQWQNNDSKTHWQQLIEGRIAERVVYRDRRTQNIEKQKVALEIRALNLPWKEQVKLAKERLGISPGAYHRALQRKL
jgi:hypothetical protein